MLIYGAETRLALVSLDKWNDCRVGLLYNKVLTFVLCDAFPPVEGGHGVVVFI